MSGVISGLSNCHLTVTAVEMKSKALTVIHKEEGSALFCVLTDRTKAKFVADAVFCTHQFDAFAMCKLVCVLNEPYAGRCIDFS